MKESRLFFAIVVVCFVAFSQLKPHHYNQEPKIPLLCTQGCPENSPQKTIRKGRVRCEYSREQTLSSIYLEYGNKNSELLCYLEYSIKGTKLYVKSNDSTYQAFDLQ